ncbi:hypothetical protein LINGRAPRIM_LOCUS315 [Linum grandiflorum]
MRKRRNERVFEGKRQNVHSFSCRFSQELALWINHISLHPTRGSTAAVGIGHMIIRQPSDLMSRSVHRRLLCDGSFQEDIHKAGIGAISVNPEGHVVDGVVGNFFCRTPIIGEARAVYAACVMAAQEGGERIFGLIAERW